MTIESCGTMVNIDDEECRVLVNPTPNDCDESGLICQIIDEALLDETFLIC